MALNLQLSFRGNVYCKTQRFGVLGAEKLDAVY